MASPLLSLAEAGHLLRRASFGPTLGSIRELRELTLAQWLETQLTPETEPEVEARASAYRSALQGPYEILLAFAEEQPPAARGQLVGDLAPVAPDVAPDVAPRRWTRPATRGQFRAALRRLDDRRLRQTHEMVELTRHIRSRYQLREVMVDFWTNHLSVFSSKGDVKIFAPDYVESVLRPRALGRFEDLLLASARHPAMLTYLDQKDSRRATKGSVHGPNENYARELLELHTLGIDGGYTQADVVAAARILTGYSLSEPGETPPAFLFRADWHDRGTKRLLGKTFGPTPRGETGEEETRALLELLARHGNTARHLATRLCIRFVSDQPPAGCVVEATEAYLESGGDMSQVLRAILLGADFWSPAHRNVKFKTPLEFLVSLSRALELGPDGSLELARQLERLGQPLLQCRLPTGYPMDAASWQGAGQLVQRVRLALRLGQGSAAGLELPWATLPNLPGSGTARTIASRLFAGEVPEGLWLRSASLFDLEAGPQLTQGEILALYVTSAEFQVR